MHGSGPGRATEGAVKQNSKEQRTMKTHGYRWWLGVLLGGLLASGSGSGTAYGAGYTFSTIAGTQGQYGYVDGTGVTARFSGPSGVAVDGGGRVFVSEITNNTVRMLAPMGSDYMVTTIAGIPMQYGFSNGPGAVAKFATPSGLAVDTAGNIYVADQDNQMIRKISNNGSGWMVSTIAGSGQIGASNGPGAMASFHMPEAVAVDYAGNVYVADLGNHMIRKLTPTGTGYSVSTLAGSGQLGSTDGAWNTATFNHPHGVMVNELGDVYVADTDNNRIRKISQQSGACVVSTLAGMATAGTNDGNGAAAQFTMPMGLAAAMCTNVLVADTGADTIRNIAQLSAACVVSTVAGTPKTAGYAEGLNPLFRYPFSLAQDNSGNIYVTDFGNLIVRKGTFLPPVTITVLASPTSGGTTTGSGTYPAGSPVTITATAATGWVFTNWTDNSIGSINSSRTIIAPQTGSATYTANFVLLQPVISGKITALTSHGSGVARVEVIANGYTVSRFFWHTPYRASTLTDLFGNYAIHVPYHWYGSVTPTNRVPVHFLPAQHLYTNVINSIGNQNFIALH
jgi:sugar lactone lactonase YvrE